MPLPAHQRFKHHDQPCTFQTYLTNLTGANVGYLYTKKPETRAKVLPSTASLK
jgi:hypothetical protein